LENPEVHPAHARHGGLPRWLELLIAVTALVTSISSIAIAVHHGLIMERLVQANCGVGPAHEQSLRVKVDGRYVESTSELIRASLGPDLAAEAEPPLLGLAGTSAGPMGRRILLLLRLRRLLGGARQMGRAEASRGMRAR
jgi:hypothetical protein